LLRSGGDLPPRAPSPLMHPVPDGQLGSTQHPGAAGAWSCTADTTASAELKQAQVLLCPGSFPPHVTSTEPPSSRILTPSSPRLSAHDPNDQHPAMPSLVEPLSRPPRHPPLAAAAAAAQPRPRRPARWVPRGSGRSGANADPGGSGEEAASAEHPPGLRSPQPCPPSPPSPSPPGRGGGRGPSGGRRAEGQTGARISSAFILGVI